MGKGVCVEKGGVRTGGKGEGKCGRGKLGAKKGWAKGWAKGRRQKRGKVGLRGESNRNTE